jgi:hypothetical protein
MLRATTAALAVAVAVIVLIAVAVLAVLRQTLLHRAMTDTLQCPVLLYARM